MRIRVGILREMIIVELRKGVFRWYKERLPGWPEYVIKDMLYVRIPSDNRNASGEVDWRIQHLSTRYGYNDPADIKWRLETISVTLDAFEPNTRETLEGRLGKHGKEKEKELSGGIPKDAERHQTQASLASDRGAPSPEPILAVRLPDGSLELLEGWHRTIQSLTKWPEGYKQRAYVFNAKESPNDPGAAGEEPDGGWEWL